MWFDKLNTTLMVLTIFILAVQPIVTEKEDGTTSSQIRGAFYLKIN